MFEILPFAVESLSWQRAFPMEALWFLGLALVICLAGFYRVVYFVSTGYAFSIAGMAVLSLWWFRAHWSWLLVLHCVGLLIYGLRLGIFLLRRELQPSYRKTNEEVKERSRGLSLFTKVMIWLSVSLLYVLMFSPSLFRFELARRTGAFPWFASAVVGLLIMGGGLFVEALADHQKSVFKRTSPDRFCDVGLYRWVRCPNYFGEILFWVGNWIAGMGAYVHWLHWLSATTGLVCIVLIMMGSTKRLEFGQDQRYGHREDYQAYVKRVPVLFPFVPIYSLKHIKVYLE